MGCDIHGPEIWGHLKEGGMGDSARKIAVLSWTRDYRCFAAIANVRNDGSITPVREPDGFPPKAWFDGSYEYERFSGQTTQGTCSAWHVHVYSEWCHSAGWLTTSDLALAHRRYIEADPYHARSMDMEMALMMMIAAENAGFTDVRLLFCFDS